MESAVPGRFADDASLAFQIKQAAEKSDDLLARVSALHSEHVLLRRTSELGVRQRLCAQLRHLSAELDDPYWLAVSDIAALYDDVVAARRDRLPQIMSDLRAHAAAAKSSRIDWHLRFSEACLMRLAGEFADANHTATTSAAAALAAGIRDAAAGILIHTFMTAFHTRGVADLLPRVDQLLSLQPQVLPIRAGRALARFEVADADGARSDIDRVIAELSTVPVDEGSLFAAALAAEVCGQLPTDSDKLRVLEAFLEPFRGQTVVFGQLMAVFGPVDRSRGWISQALGDTDTAVSLLESAAISSQSLGSEVWRIRCQADRVKLLRLAGKNWKRESELNKLQEIAMRLGLMPAVRQLG
jgi:hypothetical protein